MNYDTTYTVRFKSTGERQMLRELARRLERKESETVRVLVRGAYEALTKETRRAGKLAQEGKTLTK